MYPYNSNKNILSTYCLKTLTVYLKKAEFIFKMSPHLYKFINNVPAQFKFTVISAEDKSGGAMPPLPHKSSGLSA